ncbi:hypothetical protein ACQ4M4_28330 [Leptolyngbya sp. AN02str]|uniref:hypothetical protein n=1 Tax=Leptolyngbya sp. AN02str TaxID=3423363 RepID=UPI003D314D10
MQFILDEALEVVRKKILFDPDNEWLAKVQKKWKIALLNVGHNCRDLYLDMLIEDKITQEQIIQILNETKHAILSYGEVVPPQSQRKPLLNSNYYNVDNAPTQDFVDILDRVLHLIEN